MFWIVIPTGNMHECPWTSRVKISSKKRKLDQSHRRGKLTVNGVFFSTSAETLSGAFSPEPSPWAFTWSPPARSKVIFDGMDNSFHPDRQDIVQACPSLKLPSNCQRHSLINHFKRRSKLGPWQSRGKQWYENSPSRETQMLYHSVCFEIIQALL